MKPAINNSVKEEHIGHLKGEVLPQGSQILGINGFHQTQDGAPDRRFVENRDITPEEAEIQKAMMVLKKAGINKIE